MEKGLKLGPGALRNKAALQKSLKAFDWVYYGSEFCENLLEPGLADGLRFLSGQKKNICLLTPLLTDKGVGALKRLFALARKLRFSGRFEISVNDFGALAVIRGMGWDVPVNFGRQLSRNFLFTTRDDLAILNADGLALLEELKVGRLEMSLFSNPPRPRLAARAGRLRFTAFYPYMDVAATRTCLLGMPEVPSVESSETVRCARECLRASYRVKNENIRETLLVAGNTVFVENGCGPEAALDRGLNIDRLVFCPDT